MTRLLGDPGYQNELAQVRAKATLLTIGEPITPPRWTYVSRRFAKNSAAAAYALASLSIQQPTKVDDFKDQSRRVALAWENLAKLGEGARKSLALINSALAYEIAGYQANATCLAREVVPHLDEHIQADLESLISSFLQRKLLLTARLAEQLVRTPPDVNQELGILALKLGELVLGDALAKASRFFLSGSDSAYEQSLQLLDESVNTFSKIGAAIESNVAFGLRSVIPLMKQRSTWSQLSHLTEQSEIWKRYLTLLARGTSGPGSRGVTELWPSQIKVLDSGLLNSNNSTVIRLPTSGGKTRIAEMAIIDVLRRIPNAKCVFVAPYRALAFEVERTLGAMLGDLGFRVSSVIGSYETDDFEEFLLWTADVLIATPEKLDLVFRLRPEILHQIRLIVLDEVHIIDDQSRGVKFELLLSRIKSKLPDARFLVMSAVIPDDTLETFAEWLAGSSEHKVTSDWRPTIQRLSRFQWQGLTGVIRFEPDVEIPELSGFVPGAVRQKMYKYVHPETRRQRTRHFPYPNKGDTAAELAYVLSASGPVLVFCTQPQFAEGVCKAILSEAIEYRRAIGETIHSHLQGGQVTRSLELAREWLGQDHIATRALTQGIALHHGHLPNVVREAIESDCRANRYRIIVATNTLAQGVNLPVKTVIIHSVWRSDDFGNQSRIPVRDYWNIVGRAGRAGQETEGLVIHIVLNERDQQDFNYYSNKENIEPVNGALFQLMQELIAKRLSPETIESVANVLDPEVLAIAVEEGIGTAQSEVWDLSLNGTFAKLQADALHVDIAPLLQSLRTAVDRVFEKAPDESLRHVYSQTGLSSQTCALMRQYVLDQADKVRSLLVHGSYDNLQDFSHLVMDVTLQLPEAQTTVTFDGDHEVLLSSWLAGTGIEDIYKMVADQANSLEHLSRFVEEFFGYRLPWVVSGLIRIGKGEFGLNDQKLSVYTRNYPSMIKFGVPDPAAAWAMSAGIPTRKTAIALAQAFTSSSPTIGHEQFSAWLGGLSDDMLRHQYGITGFVLEDLRYTLGRATINHLLKPIRPLHEILPVQTRVAGTYFENRRFAAVRVVVGDFVELRRDYDNPVDVNAVAVYHHVGQLGFLPKDLAQRLAPELDAGEIIMAKVVSIVQAEVPEVTIELSISTRI
jgi:superfamily II DNA/RNA helicase